jgi:periplasmic divalent cation tolerance protein
MKYIAVSTTTGTEEEARRLARGLVERRLAACAHVDAIESHYLWNGAVQNDKEWRVVFKTTAARYAAVEQAIKELHSYELPAIYATELVQVYAPYAAWLDANSAGEDPADRS